MSDLSIHGKEVSEYGIQTLENIGKNVKYTRRNLLDVTLESMAEHTGVSRDVICRMEYLAKGVSGDGTIFPSIYTIIKFCEGVGVTISDLFDKNFQEDLDVQSRILEHCKWRNEQEDKEEK